MSHVWSDTQNALRKQLGDDVYARNLQALQCVSHADGTLRLACNDRLIVLFARRNFSDLITQWASAIAGVPVQVDIQYDEFLPGIAAPAPTPTSALGPASAPAPVSPAAPSGYQAHVATQTHNEPTAQLSLFADPRVQDATPHGNNNSVTAQAAGSRVAALQAGSGQSGSLLANTLQPAANAWMQPAGSSQGREQGRTYERSPSTARGLVLNPEDRAAECGLSPRFAFQHYIVGNSNQLAYEAARATAEQPGALYNPLFIYGGVGLGKTHLMNAIGLSAIARNPRTRVRFISAETFVNELIQSIGSGQTERFRQRNRDEVDLLLIDDIQFIAGKERTQEEFFHTFNTLYQAGKQIVLTSDRMPQEMPRLEERLVSRLSMGLMVDIQPPDLETRIAILSRKAVALGFNVSNEVINYLAENIQSNVRELHGTLLRIGTTARHRGGEVTLDLAQQQVARVVNERRSVITHDMILKQTCEHFGIRLQDIKSRRRVASIARPRKVAMYLCKKWTNSSYPEIGRYFDRDHTTILHAFRSAQKELSNDLRLRGSIEAIERTLKR